MMSLLWWGALTNQNHAWPTGVYCGSLPREFTVGAYRGSLLREFTAGVYRGSLPREFTMGAYHWLPLATTDLVGDNREFEV